MARALSSNSKGTPSFYRNGLASGESEGANRKSRGPIAATSGLHDLEFLKFRHPAIHGAEYKSAG